MTRLRRLLILAVVATFTLTIALPADARTSHSATATCSGFDGAQGTYYVKNITSSSRVFGKFGLRARVQDAEDFTVLLDTYRPTSAITIGAGKTVKIYTSPQYFSGSYRFTGIIPTEQLNNFSVTVTARCV